MRTWPTSARVVLFLALAMAAAALGLSIANSGSAATAPAATSARTTGHAPATASPQPTKTRKVTFVVTSENQVCRLVDDAHIADFVSATTNRPVLDTPPVYGCQVADSFGDGTMLQVTVGQAPAQFTDDLAMQRHNATGKNAVLSTPQGLDVPGTSEAFTANYKDGSGYVVYWVPTGSNLEFDLQVLTSPGQHPASPAQMIQSLDNLLYN